MWVCRTWWDGACKHAVTPDHVGQCQVVNVRGRPKGGSVRVAQVVTSHHKYDDVWVKVFHGLQVMQANLFSGATSYPMKDDVCAQSHIQ